MKVKIATHDSATGEKGRGFLSFLVTPFAKTQGKTIQEQYDAGCRSFDIRVREHKTYLCVLWWCILMSYVAMGRLSIEQMISNNNINVK